jgi:hypothetical protein
VGLVGSTNKAQVPYLKRFSLYTLTSHSKEKRKCKREGSRSIKTKIYKSGALSAGIIVKQKLKSKGVQRTITLLLPTQRQSITPCSNSDHEFSTKIYSRGALSAGIVVKQKLKSKGVQRTITITTTRPASINNPLFKLRKFSFFKIQTTPT